MNLLNQEFLLFIFENNTELCEQIATMKSIIFFILTYKRQEKCVSKYINHVRYVKAKILFEIIISAPSLLYITIKICTFPSYIHTKEFSSVSTLLPICAINDTLISFIPC